MSFHSQEQEKNTQWFDSICIRIDSIKDIWGDEDEEEFLFKRRKQQQVAVEEDEQQQEADEEEEPEPVVQRHSAYQDCTEGFNFGDDDEMFYRRKALLLLAETEDQE